jgi:hypothetical protein
MTTNEQEFAVSSPEPEPESTPPTRETEPPNYGSCANERCRKGPGGTAGVLKSSRA